MMNVSLTEGQGTLTTFRVTHPVHSDSVSNLNITHILGGDQDVLFLVRCIRCVNLPAGKIKEGSGIASNVLSYAC